MIPLPVNVVGGFLCVFLLFICPLKATEGDIFEQLNTIDYLTVIELTDPPEGYRAFALTYDQPADHYDPYRERFSQHFTLLHKDFSSPMIMRTSGYYNYGSTRLREPTRLLHANQLSIEHRFFGASIPQSKDYSLLTIEQAAADHHRIVKAIRHLYSGKWISTGASKGGMTAIYHRRFYPNDVDATIAYVAPNSFGHKDNRYVHFLDHVGDSTCRFKLRSLQREALLRRQEMTSLIDQWMENNSMTMDALEGGANQALDIAVAECYFQFFQYGTLEDCESIPSTEASDQEVFDFINDIFWMGYISDYGINLFQPYFYQAVTQLGYPRLNIAHLHDLLLYDPNDYSYNLGNLTIPSFDYYAMWDMFFWAYYQAQNVLFLYGENDPWSAASFGVSRRSHCKGTYKFTVPDGNHGANIEGLAQRDKERVYAILKKWTGVTPVDPPKTGQQYRKQEGPLLPPRMRM